MQSLLVSISTAFLYHVVSLCIFSISQLIVKCLNGCLCKRWHTSAYRSSLIQYCIYVLYILFSFYTEVWQTFLYTVSAWLALKSGLNLARLEWLLWFIVNWLLKFSKHVDYMDSSTIGTFHVSIKLYKVVPSSWNHSHSFVRNTKQIDIFERLNLLLFSNVVWSTSVNHKSSYCLDSFCGVIQKSRKQFTSFLLAGKRFWYFQLLVI